MNTVRIGVHILLKHLFTLEAHFYILIEVVNKLVSKIKLN